MQELYRLIEKKIKDAGYPGVVDGEELYNNICDEMEEKENKLNEEKYEETLERIRKFIKGI